MRVAALAVLGGGHRYFPSFSEGLSLRGEYCEARLGRHPDFPSFSEGLSLRAVVEQDPRAGRLHFPSFSEGLSLRAEKSHLKPSVIGISLPFRRDFH